MYKTFTSVISGLNRFVVLALPLLILGACSAHIDRDAEKQTQQENTVATIAPKEVPSVTVASFQSESDEVYFDLIANTSSCLGEDLWFGGKLEGQPKAMLGQSGALTHQKVYRITELTATGLNSNNSYLVDNKANTLRAVVDNKGNIFLQLSQGRLQLLPREDAKPLVLAYQPDATDGYLDGSVGRWSCK
ncbi:hypothetical protein [Pontibacter mangrovi]|uniref:Uncharacterized protein n=1 Tax=Pontibacter mangrovi TaxID=2589816 RepID=A0A501W7X1_9BACT|nr:hypothetical protein [Pontibacter mangrovi]TPE45418.1 hypothetical protein FJM65_05145 [Pontibacter mangrovi]